MCVKKTASSRSKQQTGARSGRGKRRFAAQQEQVRAQEASAAAASAEVIMLTEARRIVAAANRTDRRKRKSLARRERLSPEESYEILTTPMNSKSKRQEVSELDGDMGEGSSVLGGEREEMGGGSESEGSHVSEETKFLGIGAGSSAAQSPADSLLEHKDAELSVVTKGGQGAAAQHGIEPDDPGEQDRSPPRYQRSPVPDYEYEYL